ncbi:MAG: hypothetical protein EOL87_01520 [Spartobacteria bacterium]|nr:hypothetical protein [Spartobacteria bacterium]
MITVTRHITNTREVSDLPPQSIIVHFMHLNRAIMTRDSHALKSLCLASQKELNASHLQQMQPMLQEISSLGEAGRFTHADQVLSNMIRELNRIHLTPFRFV